MSPRNDMASALMSAVTTQTAADVLFAEARWLKDDFAVPSPAVARKFVKGPLEHATIIAGSLTTDPAVLAEFAKDTRVAVREALLQNPATPIETLESLTGWAMSRQNLSVLVTVLNRLDPQRAVLEAEKHADALSSSRLYRSEEAGDALAAKADNDEPLTRRLLALDIQWITEGICNRIGQGKSNAVTLVDALDGYGGPYAWLAAHAACRNATVLTCDLATIAASHDFYWEALEAAEQFTSVEEGSVQILAGGDSGKFETALLLGLDEASILERIEREQAKKDENIFSVLIRAVAARTGEGRRYSQHFETKLVEMLIAGPPVPSPAPMAGVSSRVLGGLGHALPSEMMLRWLRSQSGPFALDWVSQAPGLNSPRPGEFRALLDEPGNAFVTHRRSTYAAGAAVTQDASGFLQRVLGSVGETGPNARHACPDVIEALDPYLGPQLRTHVAAAIAVPVLERTFGSQALAWETLLTLATDWQGSLTDLIGATLDLSGCTDLSKAADAARAVPQVQENGRCMQLAFA